MNLPKRLRKLLRDRCPLSLGQIDAALEAGRVTVDGAPPPTHVEEKLIFPDQEVLLDGKPLPGEQSSRCWLLNKPKSVTSTAQDPGGKQDLSAWLARLPSGTFPVGRLDRETTGALLLTNSGDLANALLLPEHHAEKVYWLWLNESLHHDDPRLAQWTSGIPMLGGVAHAKKVELLHSTPDMSELLVTLCEGKNRQIRRMARATDFRLLHLHRRTVGPIGLDTLKPGDLRELTGDEVAALWRAVGGRPAVLEAQWRALEHQAHVARRDGRPNIRLEAWLSDHCLPDPG